jgi:hypothetical protein
MNLELMVKLAALQSNVSQETAKTENVLALKTMSSAPAQVNAKQVLTAQEEISQILPAFARNKSKIKELATTDMTVSTHTLA